MAAAHSWKTAPKPKQMASYSDLAVLMVRVVLVAYIYRHIRCIYIDR